MRLLVSIFVIVLMILGAGFWTNHALQETTRDLTAQVDRITQEIKGERWDQAIQQTKDLEKTWKEEAKWWPALLDHQEMDNIEFSLAKVKEYVASRDYPLALGQLSELKLMIEHIPRKESVKIENIF